jgi:putative hydrolase of the HAD superfamily
MLSQILCVAFDAVGTLIYPDPPVAEVYARVGRKYGSRLSEDEVRVCFRDAFRREYESRVRTSETEERLRWRRIVEDVFGLEDMAECFEELFEHFGRSESWRCFPDVAGTLGELTQRGYDLVLASNFDSRAHTICEGHAELRAFSSRVISSEVGFFKPYPDFYRALLEQTGFKRHEVLMVGDDLRNDVWGPREFGMRAVFLDRSQSEAFSQKDNVTVLNSLTGLLELLP